MRPEHNRVSLQPFDSRHRQRGASLVEFSIVGLTLIMVGLFTLQLGLLYHAKTIVNYATFEAARTGAVNNASHDAMQRELGIRLAPLQGGDGSRIGALAAVAKSSIAVKDPFNTRISILNPSRESFRDWQIRDPVTGEYFIPVTHLRHQEHTIGRHSGLSLRDATLLKLQVTHGVDLQVPVAGKLLARSMTWLDIGNAHYYLRGRWPIKSVATVRMQSRILKSEVFKSASAGRSSVGRGGSEHSEPADSRGSQREAETDDAEESAGESNEQVAVNDSEEENPDEGRSVSDREPEGGADNGNGESEGSPSLPTPDDATPDDTMPDDTTTDDTTPDDTMPDDTTPDDTNPDTTAETSQPVTDCVESAPEPATSMASGRQTSVVGGLVSTSAYRQQLAHRLAASESIRQAAGR